MVKIIFSKIARYDLKNIIDYIKQDSIKYARLEKEKIEQEIQKLIKYPFSGKVTTELNDENIREIIFRRYRIIYQIISDKQINILTIHHQSRSIANNPAFKEDK